MADLSELMKIAPTVGAGFVGENQGLQAQMELMKQRELAQIMQLKDAQEGRTQQQFPLDQAQRLLANQKTTAEIPGVAAQSQSYQLDANKKRDTCQSGVDSANAENEDKTLGHAMSRLSTLGIGDRDGVDRHVSLSDGLTRLGVTGATHDRLMDHFSKFSAADLPAEIKRINDAMLRNTPTYVQTMDHAKLQDEGATKRANILATSRIDVQDLRNEGKAGSGKATVDSDLESFADTQAAKQSSPMAKFSTYNQAAVIADQRAQQAGVAGNQADVQKYTQMAKRFAAKAAAQKQAAEAGVNQPRAGSPDLPTLSNGKVPVNAGATLTPYVPGGGQAPAAQPAAPASGAKAPPQVGAVINRGGTNWKFKGGNPTLPTSWEKV